MPDDLMEILGVMQPYLFPYLGYYQLMSLVGIYVLLDDVSYINRGWINRNRLLFQGADKYFTLPLVGASQNKLICDLFLHEPEKSKRHILNQIESYYRKAPRYAEVFPWLQRVIQHPEEKLLPYLHHTLRETATLLGLKTHLLRSSELPKNHHLKGEDRILDICRVMGARHYINTSGGMGLYGPEAFRQRGIRLQFHHAVLRPYPQFRESFVPGLSIIDMMMFLPVEAIREQLHASELVAAAGHEVA